jgi:peptidoglycan/LPS O-acetylase OafA/YrhL
MEQRKIGLDYLRAAAILCVVTAHTAEPDPLGALGFIGVEIFFVLSGYLIGSILLRSFTRHGDMASWPVLRDFWVRRWLRTIPNYFLFLPAYIAAQHFLWKRPLLMYATFTQNLAWPMGRFFGVSWSLTIEEWFYLLLPLLLALALRILGRFKPALVCTVLGMFLVPFLLRLTVCQGHPFDAGMRKIVVFRLDSLMWGVALAGAQRYRPAIFRRLCNLAWVPVGVAGMLAAAWWVWVRYRQNHAFPATVSGALVLSSASVFCAMVLPYCTTIAWKPSVFNRCAYLVSVWSYSMYLSHGLVMQFAGWYFDDPQLGKPVSVIATWILIFALSAGVYYSFERPILKWRDRLTGRRLMMPKPPELATAV